MLTPSAPFLYELEGLFPRTSLGKQYDEIARQYDNDAKKAIETLERIYPVRHYYPQLEIMCVMLLQTFSLFIKLAQQAINNPIMMKRLLAKKLTYTQLINFNSL